MLKSARSACLIPIRKLVTWLYRAVCDPRSEWDVRVNELEMAAELVAIDRVGLHQLRQEGSENRWASELLSHFDEFELTLVQEQAAGEVAMIERSAQQAAVRADRAAISARRQTARRSC